jgi:acyl-CoA thioester hydrolase
VPSAPSCEVEFRVRYSETDQMGIVYHANYLPWCEMGRTELIRRLWKSYADVEADGVLLAVTEATLRYHASARYEDMVRVVTTLEQVRSRGVTFAYEIFRVDENDGSTKRLVTARTELIGIDRAGTPRKLPADLLDAFRNAATPETVG